MSWAQGFARTVGGVSAVRKRSTEGRVVSGVRLMMGVVGLETSSSRYCKSRLMGEAERVVDERRVSSPAFPLASSMLSRYRSTTRLMASSDSGSRSSSSSSRLLGRPVVMNHTPKKVIAQPPTNLPASCPEVRSKSRYKMADPRMTDSVNKTNWTGMTWVASKRCNARLTYLICITAVPTRMSTKG